MYFDRINKSLTRSSRIIELNLLQGLTLMENDKRKKGIGDVCPISHCDVGQTASLNTKMGRSERHGEIN